MGLFKKMGKWGKKATKKVAAPAVKTVSPSAARKLNRKAGKLESYGRAADRVSTPFTAAVAKQASAVAKDAQRTGEDTGGEIAKGFAKNGLVTDFTQDYVPGGGFVTAIFHAAAGNDDYAQYAAVKGVSTTLNTAGGAAGTMMGGPTGAVLGGAAGAAVAQAWEGAMRDQLDPSVRHKVDKLTPEGVIIAGLIGGAAGGLTYGGTSAAGKAANAARGRMGRPATKIFGQAGRSRGAAGALRKFGRGGPRSRSNAAAIPGTRSRSNAFSRPPTKAPAKRGLLASLGSRGAKGYGKAVAKGIGKGVLMEVASSTGAMAMGEDAADTAVRRGPRRARRIAGIAVGLLLLGGGSLAVLAGRGTEPLPEGRVNTRATNPRPSSTLGTGVTSTTAATDPAAVSTTSRPAPSTVTTASTVRTATPTAPSTSAVPSTVQPTTTASPTTTAAPTTTTAPTSTTSSSTSTTCVACDP